MEVPVYKKTSNINRYIFVINIKTEYYKDKMNISN